MSSNPKEAKRARQLEADNEIEEPWHVEKRDLVNQIRGLAKENDQLKQLLIDCRIKFLALRKQADDDQNELDVKLNAMFSDDN
jgi:hypothetical protein